MTLFNSERVNGHDRERDVVPPHDLTLERDSLATFVSSPDTIMPSKVKASDYYAAANQIVFESVIRLHADGELAMPADDTVESSFRNLDKVRGHLLDRGVLYAVGEEYVQNILAGIPMRDTDTLRLRRLAAERRLSGALREAHVAPTAHARTRALPRIDEARRELAALEPGACRSRALTPSEVVARWREEGPLLRVRTGIEPLDEACNGGLPVPWRVMLVGAPSAGKTFVGVAIANHLARALAAEGMVVGIHAVDEEPEDVTVRLAQLVGFSIAEVEARGPHLLNELQASLESARIRLYDSDTTIEQATADTAAWAAETQRRAAYLCDSLQTAPSEQAGAATSPRELVEANVRAMRLAATRHKLLVIATCEANRASYRDADAVTSSNDMAAGAESRAIEFGAQTQLMLRTPKGHPDVVHVRIAKNRRAKLGEFWLRLNRETHELTPSFNPLDDAAAAKDVAAATRLRTEHDALALAKLVAASQGIGERGLRTALKLAGHAWGRDRLEDAKETLKRGVSGTRLVNRGTARECRWHVESVHVSEQP